jgi:hypothetical protein
MLTNGKLASANGIRMDGRDERLISFGNGIRMDGRDKRMIRFG